MDGADVDDYFYAFDKADWASADKKYFLPQYNKKYWDKILKPDGTYELEPDGRHYKMTLTDNPPKPKDVISGDLEVDNKSFELYQEKLKAKSKNYDGGVIILTEYEAPTQTSAYSRTSPLNHYKLFVYSNSVNKKEDYAHEIGHMLGLPHSFHTTKEKESYRIARENILGNEDRKSIDYNILQAKDKKYDYSNLTNFYSDKNTLKKYLDNFLKFYDPKLITGNFSENFKKDLKKMIFNNKNAIKNIKDETDYHYKNYKLECHFLASDYYLHLVRYKKYLLEILDQIQSNFMFFKQKSTKNMMDYYNTRILYNHNQIKIMRDDSKNYYEIACKCNLETNKKSK